MSKQHLYKRILTKKKVVNILKNNIIKKVTKIIITKKNAIRKKKVVNKISIVKKKYNKKKL